MNHTDRPSTKLIDMEDLIVNAYDEARQTADSLTDDQICYINIALQTGNERMMRAQPAFVHIAPFYDGAPEWARKALTNAVSDSVLARPAFARRV